jgi:hypothetical protein
MANIKLGELLVRANVLQESQLKAALVEQRRWGGKLGDILVRMSLVTEEILTRALSKQLGITAVNITSMETPPPEVMKKVPLRVAEDLHVVPLQLKDEGRTLVVAMTDPLNVPSLDTLRAVSRCRIAPVLAGRSAIERAQGRFYRGESEVAAVEDEGSFKVVDAQGRTVRKDLAEIEAEARRRGKTLAETPASEPQKMGPGEQLRALEEQQRREVASLKAMVELLVEKGVFTREEYLAKVRK